MDISQNAVYNAKMFKLENNLQNVTSSYILCPAHHFTNNEAHSQASCVHALFTHLGPDVYTVDRSQDFFKASAQIAMLIDLFPGCMDMTKLPVHRLMYY